MKEVEQLKTLIQEVWEKEDSATYQINSKAFITIENVIDCRFHSKYLFLELISTNSLYPDLKEVLDYAYIKSEDIESEKELNKICERMLKGVKKRWKIPVCWEMYGIVEVEADTIEEAMKIAKDDNGKISLPEGNYVDDSWNLSCDDPEYIRECFNNNQLDNSI